MLPPAQPWHYEVTVQSETPDAQTEVINWFMEMHNGSIEVFGIYQLRGDINPLYADSAKIQSMLERINGVQNILITKKYLPTSYSKPA